MARSSGDFGTNRKSSGMTLPICIQLCGREDYTAWKFKMRNYLIHEDLWETINGYPECDATPEITKKRNDQKALAKICLSLDGPAITHVRSSQSAKEAWNSLKNAY